MINYEFDDKTKNNIEKLRDHIKKYRDEYEEKYRETPCVFAGNKRSGCVICKGLVYDRIMECDAFFNGRRIQITYDEGDGDPYDY